MLKQIAQMRNACFPHREPWDEKVFLELKASGYEMVVSQNSFIVWRQVCDEIEIVSLGVMPDARGTGVGNALLVLIEHGSPDVKTIFLEVSEKNIYAQNLYKRNGYEQIGLRKDYYGVGENAITMRKIIKK
ncbi:MAG: GNAT family N-acetyltransferase [Rickettsiales bacterium]|jgi:ribosomal-protein-alanine N-acetyltransferase|nr:GNAT family N-acetyltransferase [Rickettsiales bacterium]